MTLVYFAFIKEYLDLLQARRVIKENIHQVLQIFSRSGTGFPPLQDIPANTMQILVVNFKSVLHLQCAFWSKHSTKLPVKQVVQKILTDSSPNCCSFSTKVPQRLGRLYTKNETITAGRRAKPLKVTDKSKSSTNPVGNEELLLLKVLLLNFLLLKEDQELSKCVSDNF